ncbi:unnamed protein product, partial [Amoebophrya sp. A25]
DTGESNAEVGESRKTVRTVEVEQVEDVVGAGTTSPYMKTHTLADTSGSATRTLAEGNDNAVGPEAPTPPPTRVTDDEQPGKVSRLFTPSPDDEVARHTVSFGTSRDLLDQHSVGLDQEQPAASSSTAATKISSTIAIHPPPILGSTDRRSFPSTSSSSFGGTTQGEEHISSSSFTTTSMSYLQQQAGVFRSSSSCCSATNVKMTPIAGRDLAFGVAEHYAPDWNAVRVKLKEVLLSKKTTSRFGLPVTEERRIGLPEQVTSSSRFGIGLPEKTEDEERSLTSSTRAGAREAQAVSSSSSSPPLGASALRPVPGTDVQQELGTHAQAVVVKELRVPLYSAPPTSMVVRKKTLLIIEEKVDGDGKNMAVKEELRSAYVEGGALKHEQAEVDDTLNHEPEDDIPGLDEAAEQHFPIPFPEDRVTSSLGGNEFLAGSLDDDDDDEFLAGFLDDDEDDAVPLVPLL